METAGAPLAERSPGTWEVPSRIEVTWIALAILLPAMASLVAPMRMVDLAYQLRAGEVMLESGSLLRSEMFSFVGLGSAWLNQQWLAQLLLAIPYRAGGFEALVAIRAISIGLIAWMLFLACRVRGTSRTHASWLTIAGVVIAFPSMALRPQLFGAVLFATALWILASAEARPRLAWWLVPLAVVWANLHGSFALLPIMVGLAALEAWARGRRDESRRLVVVGAVTIASTLLTPYTLGGWRYVAELATNPDIRERITEWAPITFSGWQGWLFFASGVAVIGLLISRRPLAWTDVLWAGGFFTLAWSSQRAVVWWGLVAVWIVAGEGPVAGLRGDRGGPPPHLPVIGALAAGVVVLSPWVRGVTLEDAPIGLATAVRDHTLPGARLVVAQRYASWFELAAPQQLMFVDSRIERFPSRVWDDYADVAGGDPRWISVIARWDVDAVVTEAGWPVVEQLRADSGWEAVYRDADGWVFVRR